MRLRVVAEAGSQYDIYEDNKGNIRVARESVREAILATPLTIKLGEPLVMIVYEISQYDHTPSQKESCWRTENVQGLIIS